MKNYSDNFPRYVGRPFPLQGHHEEKRVKKYQDNYNYHDWTKFMVEKPEQKPTGPHYAAILLEKENRYQHDHYTGKGDSIQVDSIKYFAFPDEVTLKEWILRATKEKKSFFFFYVAKLGEAAIHINVDLGV